MTAEEYINVDDNVIAGGLTDGKIVAAVYSPEEEPYEEITQSAAIEFLARILHLMLK